MCEFCIQDAVGFEFYVQLGDETPIDGTRVHEPADYCEKTALLFDEELEAVFLVIESVPFGVYLYLRYGFGSLKSFDVADSDAAKRSSLTFLATSTKQDPGEISNAVTAKM